MLKVLNITVPVFLIIAMGYLAVRYKLFTYQELQGSGRFVMKVGLPALVFHTISMASFDSVFQAQYLLGYGLGSLLAFIFGWTFGKLFRRQSNLEAALSGGGMSMSNTGFIGYPLLVMAIGSSAGQYFAMNVLVENLLSLPLFIIMADAAKSNGGSRGAIVRDILRNLVRNPMILAIPVALVFTLTGLEVPVIIEKVTAMLSTASAPVALFVIGGGLVGLRLRGSLPDIALIGLGKLLVFPALTSSMVWLLGGSSEAIFAAALLASVPMLSIFPLLCAQYGYGPRGSAAMLMTVVLSFVTVSLLLLFGH